MSSLQGVVEVPVVFDPDAAAGAHEDLADVHPAALERAPLEAASEPATCPLLGVQALAIQAAAWAEAQFARLAVGAHALHLDADERLSDADDDVDLGLTGLDAATENVRA